MAANNKRVTYLTVERLEERCAPAVDIFLKVAGIPGESTDQQHPGEIVVDSYSFGVTNTNRQELHVVTAVDKASPQLLLAAATGKPITSAVLSVRNTGQQVDLVEYTMQNVVVSSFQIQSQGDTLPLEEVSFTFGRLTEVYQPLNSDGSTTGGAVTGNLNLQQLPAVQTSETSLLQATPAQGFANMFLQATGISGDSTDLRHPGQIQIESFSWGVENSSTNIGSSTGGGAGKVTFQDFHVAMTVSKASPSLVADALTSKVLKNVVLSIGVGGQILQPDFLQFALQNALIDSYAVQDVAAAEPVEEVSFTFGKVSEQYQPQTEGAPPVVTNLTARAGSLVHVTDNLLSTAPAGNACSTQLFLAAAGVNGDSTDSQHIGQIDVQSFSWGLSVPISGTGVSAGKSAVQSFDVVMAASKASPQLLLDLLTGKHLASAVLSVDMNGEPLDFLQYSLKNVLLTSYQIRDLGDSLPMEQVNLSYASLTQTYQPANGGNAVTASVKVHGVTSTSPTDLLYATPALGSADIFLTLAGISGESTNAQHPGAIDIESFSWGASSTIASGTGSASGKPTIQDFHVVMLASKASPQLLEAEIMGTVLTNGTLSVSNPDGLDFLTYAFTNVLVSSYQVKDSGNTIPAEEVGLTFSRLTESYQPVTGGNPVTAQIGGNLHLVTVASGPLLDATPDLGAASTSAFLEVSGINGDSTTPGHVGEINVSSFSWGVSQTGLQDFHVVMQVSEASPTLLLDGMLGKHLGSAVLALERSGQTADFLTYTLQDVTVSSYQVTGSTSGLPTEEVTFRLGTFGDIGQMYQPVNADGIAVGDPLSADEDFTGVRISRSRGESLLNTDTLVPGSANLFLEISGIRGDSQDTQHPGEIEVQSFSWGMGAATTSVKTLQGSTPSLQDFHVVMSVNRASPILLADVAAGKHVGSAVLAVRKASEQSDFLTYTLQEMLVSSFQVRSSTADLPLEEVTFRFNELTADYQIQDANGNPVGQPITADLDFTSAHISRTLGPSLLDSIPLVPAPTFTASPLLNSAATSSVVSNGSSAPAPSLVVTNNSGLAYEAAEIRAVFEALKKQTLVPAIAWGWFSSDVLEAIGTMWSGLRK